MPPTTSVSDPTIPRKSEKASMKTSKNWNCSVVSQTEKASLSSGSNFSRCESAARRLSVTAFDSSAEAGWKNEVREVLPARQRAERRPGDPGEVAVAAVVARVLLLRRQDADDEEGGAPEEDRLPTGRSPCRRRPRDLVPEEDDPALVLHVERVRNRPPGTGIRFRISPNSGATPETSTGRSSGCRPSSSRRCTRSTSASGRRRGASPSRGPRR